MIEYFLQEKEIKNCWNEILKTKPSLDVRKIIGISKV